jgi:5-hydroxyisourate hydrolase
VKLGRTRRRKINQAQMLAATRPACQGERVTVSTHALDAVRGRPATGVEVLLERRTDDGWASVAARETDADGRISDLAEAADVGVYRLTFDVEGWAGADSFYPEVVIVFRITDAAAHHHVPVLLSPYAYSTYRGS